jgi:serine protease Do
MLAAAQRVAQAALTAAVLLLLNPTLTTTGETLPSALSKTIPESLADLRAIEDHVKALLPKVTPAVVAIQIGDTVGSGVIVSPDGLVLSAAHVGDRPGREVRFIFANGKKARGKTLGTDHELDAGMMRITDAGPWPHLEPAPAQEAKPGDWALTLGHPGGWDPDRSLVVRLGRVIRSNARTLQSDCTITAGDSGGPLLDMKGRVIGIHTYVRNSTAENYHVPIAAFREDWERLLKGESWGSEDSAPRPWLGTRGVDANPGCRIEVVDERGPAFKAGLQVGDVVLSINGSEVEGAEGYRRLVRDSQIGSQLRLKVKRDAADQIITVQVADRNQR